MRKVWQTVTAMALLLSYLFTIPAKAVSSNPTPTCVGSNCTIDFAFTGDFFQWTAPSTGNYVIEAWGAQGGNAQYNGTIHLYGGAGGYAKGTYAATAGQLFYIYVGGQGASSTNSTNDFLAGGFNGGGRGFNSNTTSTRGSGGGGGTDIRVSSNGLANRIIVAGGGSGNTYDTRWGVNTAGVGGGSTGGDGSSATQGTTYTGKGGTSSAGGARGQNCGVFPGTAGSLGLGGDGETSTNHSSSGGGGGYYGGGGSGCQFAGGGGSGYVGSLTSTTLTAGNASMPNPTGGTMTGRTGNGFVRIAYTYTAPTISLTSAGNSTSASKGVGIVLTAAINSTGFVTFYANNKRIPKCINLAASSGNKTCTWVPTGVKNAQVYATFSQSGSVVATSTSISFALAKRMGLR